MVGWDMVGFLAGLLFACSALPLTWSTIKSGKTDAPWLTIILIGTGALLMEVYALGIGAIPLAVDMVVTLLCWVTIGVIKWRSKNIN